MEDVLNKVFSALLLIFIFVSMAVHFVSNSSSGVLGKDESLYIFLARGHYSHTPIDVPTGSWLDAVKKGMIRTADPAGFFLLLHFWEYVSYSETWLRFLPYLFFVISVIILMRICILVKLPLFLSVSFGFLPFASREMTLHAIEIRGYGMELCLTYLIIYAALKIITMVNEDIPPDKGKWIIFSLIMIAGLSSRFSFVIASTAMYIVLGLIILLKKKTSYFKKSLLSLTISSFIALLFFIVFWGMRVYFISEDTLNSVSVDFNTYTIPGTFFDKIKYFLRQMHYLPTVLFAGSGVFMSPFRLIAKALLLSGGGLIVYHIAHNLIRENGVAKIKGNLLLYYGLFLFPLLSVILSMFLALLGLHPFSIESRWSLYLQPSFHLLIIGIIKIAIDKDGRNPQKEYLFLNRFHRIILTYILGLIVLIYGWCYLSYKVTFRMGGGQHTKSVICSMFSDSELKDVDYWYISVGEADSFKYHVLYGRLKNKLSPKTKIVIENRPARLKKVTCSELEDIYKNAKKDSKVVMVLGHVDKKEAEVYKEIFSRYFKNAKYGEHESSYEQVCYAVL